MALNLKIIPKAYSETEEVLNIISNKFNKNYTSKKEMKNLSDYFDKVAFIESEGGKVNKLTSAKGNFQFLTANNSPGKNDNSFQVALNRYENLTGSSPEWLKNARETNDPLQLTYEQEKALAIANLAKMDKPTLKLFDSIAQKGYKNNPDAYSLYADYHHTNPDDDTKLRAESILEILNN